MISHALYILRFSKLRFKLISLQWELKMQKKSSVRPFRGGYKCRDHMFRALSDTQAQGEPP